MNASPAVASLIRAYEPYRATPQDGLVGWGHRITGEYEIRDYRNGITTEQAEELLSLAIRNADHGLNDYFTRISLVLTQNQYDALASLYIQAKSLSSSFLMKMIRSGNEEGIRKEWAKWGLALPGTESRRAAELRLFLTGSFTE